MNQNQTALLLALGAGALLIYKKASAAQKLNMSFDRVTSWGMQGDQVKVQIQFLIVNPTTESFNIKSLLADLMLNGIDVGDAYTTVEFSIPANTTAAVKIDFLLNAQTVVSELVQKLLGTNGKSLTAQIVGRVNLNGFPIPIDETFSL